MTGTARPTPERHPVQRGAKSAAAKQWKRDVGIAHAARTMLANGLREKQACGKRVQPYIRQYLAAAAARFCGALAALRGEADRQAAEALAATVNPWREGYRPIRWHKHAKKTGGYRPICALPPDLKALHYVIAGALKAAFVPNDHIYGVTGRGRDEAARRLKEAQKAGLTYLAKLDIVDCFQSINPDSLYQLPLPKEVIRRALDTRNMTFEEWEPQKGTTDNQRLSGIPMLSHSESGPRGLLQGSPASNLILAWLLNDMPMPEGALVLICTDNLAVAAKDPTTRQTVIESLVAYFQRDCPAGPLNLCPAVYAGPGTEPLDFLSYEFDPDHAGIGIAASALSKLEGRLVDLEDDETLDDLTFALATWQALRSFRSGFSAAADVEAHLERYAKLAGFRLDGRHNALLSDLHAHVFDPPTTTEGAVIARLLQGYRLPKHRNNNCMTGLKAAE
ncbi:Reverse transcriptase (RNA-dependent DNA polymerase) [Gemmobacter aquatilis]|uniref:Reverse transcriptase (RNA-dependent DNA polymerase) n=1 Tax=Gemmobacter aquatilis TaxID=933059 RepID=A0A1H7Z5H9_9RHOB|nr:reverse transcriptase domain-containing protein [Gemmobacter aquatilis]SEM53700.1 Reverse transcriptase (RNA-dependent DNA polymerase) [Gemmobacter aquatilis]